MKRLLHVFATFGAGGPQVRATQLIARLGGTALHTIVAMDEDRAAERLLPAGHDVELLLPPPKAPLLTMVSSFARLLRERRPDLVLTYNWGAIEAAWAARRLSLPHVHHEDGFGPGEVKRRFLRRSWLRRYVLSRSPVIVPSSVLHGIARREWKLRTVHHLPNGVDLQRFAPSAPATPLVLGTVGGLRQEKDHATLLRAFARMRHQDCVLRLVGDGPLRGPLRALAEDLGIQPRVQFAGAIADPAPEYRAFSLFVLSSQTEQMPLSMLEAMASGLPVVATDVGDVRDMLPMECRGSLVPANYVEALAQALDALVGDPARRQREGQLNRAHCEQHYELGQCLQRYVEVYERAMR